MLLKKIKKFFNRLFNKKNKKIDNPVLLLNESANTLSTFFYNNKDYINKSNANLLINDINNYCKRLNNIINNFNSENDLNNALKGKSKEALIKYINDLVSIVNIYTNSYVNLANNIENYIKGDING